MARSLLAHGSRAQRPAAGPPPTQVRVDADPGLWPGATAPRILPTMLNRDDLMSLLADRPVAVRALAALWALVTVVHVTIWLMIAAIGGHLDRPWWLLVSAPLGAVVALACWWTAPRETEC